MGSKTILLLFIFVFAHVKCNTPTSKNITFIAKHYDIQIRPILDKNETAGEQYTAPGFTTIWGTVQSKTSSLKLFAYQLTINKESVKVSAKNGSESVNVIGVDTTFSGNLTIKIARELEIGEELEIYIEHMGRMTPYSENLVHSSYLTESGEERRLAATRYYDELNERPFFEVWRAFPCFNEEIFIWPDKKSPLKPESTFDLTVIRKNNYTSLANTDRVSFTPDPKNYNWIMDKYARTGNITPSLVSILVSDFDHVSMMRTSPESKTVNIHAPQYLLKGGGGEYAAHTGAKLVDYFEQYFNTSFQSSKMDFAVIPKFFKPVESLGLTFLPEKIRDVQLLHRPKDTLDAKLNVDGTISQALARQWVGPWWNNMYLNEGIVKYLKYVGMEAADPGMSFLETSYLEAVKSEFNQDTNHLENHTLSGRLWKVEAIANRGATLLRMLETIFPPDTIQKSLQNYVKKVHEDGNNPDHEEFFNILQEASGKHNKLNVSSFMHSWSGQIGYPLVKVELANESFVKFSQERFKASNEGEDINQNATWQIPLQIVTKNNATSFNDLWLEQNGASKSLKHNSEKWIIANYNASGYYRVLYDDQLLKRIQNQLEKNASMISPLTRAQLLDDYFVFAEKNYSNVQTALNLTLYMEKENEYVVWHTALDYFNQFDIRFSSHSGYPHLQKYLQKRLDSVLTSIGLEIPSAGELTMTKILRNELLEWACTRGNPSSACSKKAKKLLKDLKSSNVSSFSDSPSLNCAVVATGGKDAFDIFNKRYKELVKNNGKHDERKMILKILACATDKKNLDHIFKSTVNENSTDFVMEDGKFVLEQLAQKPEGRSQMLPFLKENLDKILDFYGPNKYNRQKPKRVKRTRFISNEGAELVEKLLDTTTLFYSTQAQLDEVATFAKENKGKLAGKYENIEHTLETRKRNVKWMDTTGKEILEWLKLQNV